MRVVRGSVSSAAARVMGLGALRIGRIDAVRAGIAGTRAVAVRAAAKTLFEAGGSRVLPAAVQRAVRGTIEREASRMLAAVGVVERALEGGAGQAVAVQGARAAGRQILRGVSTAAAAGAVIDGGVALVQAIKRVRAGSMTRKEAATHVAREASTGAAATAAGTAAAAMLVAEKYRGIRPAFGYPACPDHSEKTELFGLLQAGRLGVTLTEHFAMMPAASVSGIYLGHPQASYFQVGRLGRDQIEDYARRKGTSMAEVERWLSPNLAYDPIEP